MAANPGSFRERLKRISLAFLGLLFVLNGGIMAVSWLVYAKNPADGVGFTAAATFAIIGTALILLDLIQRVRD